MVVIARFGSERGLNEAARRLKEEPLGPFEIHSPHPVSAAEEGTALVPAIVLAAGLLGFFASLSLQIYAASVDYVLDVGGRPADSWPAFIPTAFENGVLCAILAGFIAFLRLSMARADLPAPAEATMLDSYYLTLRPADEIALERAYEHFRAAKAELTVEVPP